jgi:hypothetical protein
VIELNFLKLLVSFSSFENGQQFRDCKIHGRVMRDLFFVAACAASSSTSFFSRSRGNDETGMNERRNVWVVRLDGPARCRLNKGQNGRRSHPVTAMIS